MVDELVDQVAADRLQVVCQGAVPGGKVGDGTDRLPTGRPALTPAAPARPRLSQGGYVGSESGEDTGKGSAVVPRNAEHPCIPQLS
jgi:hypothetical protein